MLDEKGSREVHALGVDYSHLINQAGSPEPLQLIRSKKNNSTPFFVKPIAEEPHSSAKTRKGGYKQVNAFFI